MNEVSTLRFNLLRAMYLLIAAGLATTVWPHIVSPPNLVAGPTSVIRALLGALAVMSLLGQGLDDYASETLFACLMGVVLVPIVIPWSYVIRRYVRSPGEPWISRRQAQS